jgi:uncharacterized protein (TIGR03437 family)
VYAGLEKELQLTKVEMWRNSMKRHKTLMFGAALCLIGLGFSDTASGQITTVPALSSGMNFQVQSGGASSSQQLMVRTSNDPTTLDVIVPANQSWLTVNSNPAGTSFFPNTPASLTVTVNTTGLLTNQIVSTTISIQINGQPSTKVAFPVTLTVGTPSILTANPANIAFSAVLGSSSGTSSGLTEVPVTITSSGAQLNYNVSASTQSGGNWIGLTNTAGTTGPSPGFQVNVNPSGLAAGNYTGTLLVQSTSTGDSVSIQVTLAVTVGATLNVTGTPLQNFIYQFNSGQAGFNAQQQTLMISATSGTVFYSVIPTAVSGPTLTTNWLNLSQSGGTATSTPQPLYLSLVYSTVAALNPGTYVINLAIGQTGPGNSANTVNVTVTLVVSNNPILTVNTRSLAFTVPFGTISSQSQTIAIGSSTGASIPYTLSTNVNWLTLSPINGNTSANPIINVSVNASGLAVSSTPYMAIINIAPTNSDFGLYSIPIAVSVTVTGAISTIYAGPAALLFGYQTTQSPPQAQLVQLTGTTTLGFSVSTTTMGGSNCPTTNWLGATPNQMATPATMSVSVATTGMTSGFCTGSVIVTYNNGTNANTTVIIPVTVNISATPLLTVTPPFGFGVVTASSGSSALISSGISINTTDGSAVNFSATASTPNAPVAWLSLGGSQGSTPGTLTVNILPGGLSVGVYTGTITIAAQNSANLPSGALSLPVTLTVSASTTVTVSPTSLSFTQAQGTTTLPAAQTITMTASGGNTSFTASVSPVTGGNWLQVTPLSGNVSGTISASIVANTLSPGTYTSNIILTFLNSATPTATVPVSLVVLAQSVTVAPTSLSFSYQLGSTAPPSQTLNVTSTGGVANVSVSASSTGGWLGVTPTTGSTGASGSPLAVTVSVTPTSLTAAGTYNGTITITPNGLPAITVAVTITVTGVPLPQPSTISNSASGAFGAISPGELITIKGTALGPSTAANFTVNKDGTVSSTLAGVQVLFDTIPGTPTYVSATQINVIVPYEIAGRASTTITVSNQGQASGGIPQQIANQAPGVYTFSATGAGQAAVLNQNGSINGPSTGIVVGGQNVATTPAPQGTVIAVYMTGGGQTSPAGVTGTVTPTNQLYKIPGTVTATINGVNAVVEFAGAAPALVTGVIQVNLLVPFGVTGNGLPIAVTINGNTSPSGPTISVQ